MSFPTTGPSETLGVRPALGRWPGADDSEAGGGAELRLDHPLRVGPGGVIGWSVLAAGKERTIIGVMPPDFFFPVEAVTLWVRVPPSTPEPKVGST